MHNNLSSVYCWNLSKYATTVKVLKSIDDGTNIYLNNEDFSKTKYVDCYVYTKILSYFREPYAFWVLVLLKAY